MQDREDLYILSNSFTQKDTETNNSFTRKLKYEETSLLNHSKSLGDQKIVYIEQ